LAIHKEKRRGPPFAVPRYEVSIGRIRSGKCVGKAGIVTAAAKIGAAWVALGSPAALSERFGAPGDFAQAHVLTHELGHHVQQLLGTGDRVRRAEEQADSRAEVNRYSVGLELQADCYAGVWAAHASEVSGGKVALEPGDLQEGLRAASAVADDTLQRQTRTRRARQFQPRRVGTAAVLAAEELPKRRSESLRRIQFIALSRSRISGTGLPPALGFSRANTYTPAVKRGSDAICDSVSRRFRHSRGT
jgi:hypothetical protein